MKPQPSGVERHGVEPRQVGATHYPTYSTPQNYNGGLFCLLLVQASKPQQSEVERQGFEP